ncbi:hypothetical protein [Cytobacillus firmus]|uniref:SMODS-associated NUDIX domain-containing protein n=1 Tax=Cytobacillus firmus TaxID=1399 RepID=UPI0034A4CDAE
MRKFIFYFITFFISILLIFFVDGVNTNIIAIACGVVASIVMNAILYLSVNFNNIKFLYKSKILYRKEDIRVSISYLFRIKIDGKYLLVKGNRIQQYQPVGGVYKRYKDSDYIFSKLDVKEDVKIPEDDAKKNDLRVRVKGENLIDFLNWFKGATGREISAEREFKEEVLSSGLVNKNAFPYLKYKFIKRIQDEIKFDEHFQCQQILIADIYELILDDFQLSELTRLVNTESGIFTLASELEIDTLGASLDGKARIPISRTSKWIV